MPQPDIQSKPIVSVAMLGARMHFAVPSILAQAGLLHTLYTDTYVGNKTWLRGLIDLPPKRLKPKALRQLSERASDGIPANRVVSFDRLGLSYFLRRRRALTPAALTALFAQVNTEFGESVIRAGLNDSKYIFGFNGAALEIFAYARERGIKCILEQTMAPRKLELEVLAEEQQRWPDWQTDITTEDVDPLVEREMTEWKLADKIICGSNFVADALRTEGVGAERISVVPYGVDVNLFKTSQRKTEPKLKVLFVGELGLRKGLPYLLEALRLIDRPRSIHAKLVGTQALNRDLLKRYSEWCQFVGSTSRRQVIGLYQWADVLVLPSLCEGSATVTYEAMACGLPVITTPNSGSLVRDGVEGFVVPIRDVAQLKSRIALLRDDLRLRMQMSAAASQRRGDISLEAYAARLLRTLTYS